MVTRLVGMINGKPISFVAGENNTWSGIVPANLRGIYVVELTAMDEAGNVAYMTDVIVTIDTTKLAVSIEIANFGIKILENYYCDVFVTEYQLRLLPYDVLNAVMQEYDIKRGWLDGVQIHTG